MTLAGISRVSNQMQANALLSSVRRNNLDLARVQAQLATGQRLLTPSVDPPDANSALSLERVLAEQEQLLSNIQSATASFSYVDSSLGDASDLLRNAVNEIAAAHVGTGVTADQKAEAALLVEEIARSMLGIANKRVGDAYLFGGTGNTEAPFVSEAGGIRYVGTEQATRALLGDATPTNTVLTGSEVFGALSGEVAGYRDLRPAMDANTRLSDLAGAGGEGIRLGTIVIDDGNTHAEIDLTGADRIGDVIERIIGIPDFFCGLSLDGKSLWIMSMAPGADLTITETGGGRLAHDLGLYFPTADGVVVRNGDCVRPQVTEITPLANLAGGAGLDLASGLVITNGTKSETFSFAADVTVGDLLNRINNAELGVHARINAAGDGIDIVNALSGSAMTIGENGGTTAEDLGVRSMRGGTNLAVLNDGVGVRRVAGMADLRVTAGNGSSFDVNLDGATTVQDVIDTINAGAAGAGVAVTAGIVSVGNGIVLTDGTGGGGDFSVTALNASDAAADLGLAQTVSGLVIDGGDRNPIHPDGVFANLAQLAEALRDGDDMRINRVSQRLEADMDRVVRLRARVGGLARCLEDRADRTEDGKISNQSLLSELKDTDFTEAVTRFQALQTIMEATLMTGANSLNLSLLDFLR